jgi:hypothetical protein
MLLSSSVKSHAYSGPAAVPNQSASQGTKISGSQTQPLLEDDGAIKERNIAINPEIVSGSQSWKLLQGKKK